MNLPHGPAKQFLPEVQAIRAIAVAAVLLFHVFPESLPGGYVGVDVFFVISGFLITGILLREIDRTGTISLSGFYARRIKRLLPAATLVLLTVGLAIPLLPEVRWIDTATEIMASALYVENWWLAARSVDYLAQEDAPSPVQHYWSLSVEEQFYIVWPIFLLAAVAFARKARLRMDRLVSLLTIAVVTLSLAYSMYFTSQEPGRAYFATTTRIWEMGLGALLASSRLATQIPDWFRRWCSALGLVLIGGAALAFDQSTVFPGAAALLPTIGAALMIIAAGSRHIGLGKFLNHRLTQSLGDISYSVYLWHWPLVVWFVAVSGHPPDLFGGICIIAATLLLAAVTKHQVEDRFRADAIANRGLRPAIFAGGCIASTLLISGVIFANSGSVTTQSVIQGSAAASSHPGGAALFAGAVVPATTNFIPTAVAARLDRADAYAEKCISQYGSDLPQECSYPSSDPSLRVVLVGDSHAVQWLPALQEIAADRKWHLTALTKVSCTYADVMVMTKQEQPFEECKRWSDAVHRRVLQLNPDLVIATQSLRYDPIDHPRGSVEGRKMLVAGIRRRWNGILDAGIPVVTIRDTPRMSINVPDCLSAAGATIEQCSPPRDSVLYLPDATMLAAQEDKRISLVDMSDGICNVSTCPAVVGNVLVWMDNNHITATYARSLTPMLATKIDLALYPRRARRPD